ncbi:alanine--tRNA ligase-related protein [Nocardia brasiliensis]|uniref:alanine--tRNA ligase-related protein n=1 Tax=Nocardia brasiliensis TaxID=37326 RepID=UPI001E3B18CF|nr:alanine--tRNA ligase-related protein [Nocardia brasiliensis]
MPANGIEVEPPRLASGSPRRCHHSILDRATRSRRQNQRAGSGVVDDWQQQATAYADYLCTPGSNRRCWTAEGRKSVVLCMAWLLPCLYEGQLGNLCRGRASSQLAGRCRLTSFPCRRPETVRWYASVLLPDLPCAVVSGRFHIDGATTMITTDQTVQTFLDYFRERGHERTPGGSLIPSPGDPVLFTTSGMHPLTPYLLGRPHPLGQRLTGLQRCLRTTDLEEVGDDTHLTVFEMLGSWSLGDYGGSQSLRWGFELLRDGFGIEPSRMHVTVFGGDEQVEPDRESWRTCDELGLPVEPTTDENWWSNGPTGLCGPDAEIFVWTGDEMPQGTPTSDDRWVEVWNHVMMRYFRHPDGILEPLRRPGIDTGLGLERLVRILRNTRSVFEIDVFLPWLNTLPRLWGPLDERSLRLLSDHLRSSIVVLGDRVTPSPSGRGYVLRRLIRRILTTLWRDDPTRTLSDLPIELIEHTLGHFRQSVHPHDVRAVLLDEERKFVRLLQRGRKILSHSRFTGRLLTEDDYRYLHDTHGLPRDLLVYLNIEADVS